MPAKYDALLALAGAILGGSGLKVIEHWLNKSKDKSDMAKDFRNELRTDLIDAKKELDRVEAELDSWKDKYYLLMNENLELKQRSRSSPDK